MRAVVGRRRHVSVLLRCRVALLRVVVVGPRCRWSRGIGLPSPAPISSSVSTAVMLRRAVRRPVGLVIGLLFPSGRAEICFLFRLALIRTLSVSLGAAIAVPLISLSPPPTWTWCFVVARCSGAALPTCGRSFRGAGGRSPRTSGNLLVGRLLLFRSRTFAGVGAPAVVVAAVTSIVVLPVAASRGV